MSLNCSCAACNMQRMREKENAAKALAEFDEMLKRGAFDHLKPNHSEGQKP